MGINAGVEDGPVIKVIFGIGRAGFDIRVGFLSGWDDIAGVAEEDLEVVVCSLGEGGDHGSRKGYEGEEKTHSWVSLLWVCDSV